MSKKYRDFEEGETVYLKATCKKKAGSTIMVQVGSNENGKNTFWAVVNYSSVLKESEIELEPSKCPICDKYDHAVTYRNSGPQFSLFCQRCGLNGPGKPTKVEAAIWWSKLTIGDKDAY